MPNIRYVCVSDLHLGARNSVLTNLDADGQPADGPAPVLEAVLGGLGDLIAASGTTTPPTLVIHGDLFEMALTSLETAAASFGELVEMAWGDPSAPLFAPQAVFVPGNHDHHMWELMREHDFEVSLGRSLVGLRPMQHVTPMQVRPRGADDREPLVEAFARMALFGRDAPPPSFAVVYPNLGLVSETGDRAVVITHGHYLEPMYRAMSYLHDVVDPSRPPGLSVDDVEADNWAWIDFFWSTMGRSGADGEAAVPVLYEMLQDDAALSAIVARTVDDALPPTRSLVRTVERAVIGRLGRKLARQVSARERHQSGLLSRAATAGLDRYLVGPVHSQLTTEVGHVPARVDLVFGHTHKPFALASRHEGYENPVVAHNTGGWVVDSVESEPVKGAAITLISDELEVVDVCIYRQHAWSRPPRVSVMAAPGRPVEPSPLREWLVEALAADSERWSSVATLAADTVRERQRQLEDRIQRGAAAARGSGPREGVLGW